MTEQEICQMALDVQDACNLSGVVHSWSQCVTALWDINRERGWGTLDVNTHPACQLFADKLADLARVRGVSAYSEAYAYCTEHSRKGG